MSLSLLPFGVVRHKKAVVNRRSLQGEATSPVCELGPVCTSDSCLHKMYTVVYWSRQVHVVKCH